LEVLPLSERQPPEGARKDHPFFDLGKAFVGGVKQLEVKAGGAVLFGSQAWHRSSTNRSESYRRVFYAQYSDGAILSDGSVTRKQHLVRKVSVCEDSKANGSVDARGGKDAKILAPLGTLGNSGPSEALGARAQACQGPLSFAVPCVPKVFDTEGDTLGPDLEQ